MNPTQSDRLLVLVCLVSLLSTVGMALPYPILTPLFVNGPADGFTRFAGLPSEWLLGVALAINPLGILLGSFWLGPLSDRLGRRPVLMASLLAGALAHALTAFAITQRNYPLFIVARLASGLCEGNIAIARALLADAYAPAERTRAFALLNAFAYAGWLVGPLLGGWVFAYGGGAPFLLAAALNLPAWLLAYRALPREQRVAATSPQQGLGTWAVLRAEPGLRALAACHIALTLGVNALYEYAPLWLVQRWGWGSAGIAWVTAAQCAVMVGASMAAAGLLARLHAWAPRTQAALATASLMAVAVAAGLAVLATGQPHGGLMAILLMGVPIALYNAVLPTHLAARYMHLGQGRVMGMMTTWFCIANVVISLVGGVLGWLDVRWTMGLGAACCLLAAWWLRGALDQDRAMTGAVAQGEQTT
ncbi:MAG: MFS transporter [Proteobacteria bacterium]|nr:MFS transporter [Pseudomonadota bacterium]